MTLKTALGAARGGRFGAYARNYARRLKRRVFESPRWLKVAAPAARWSVSCRPHSMAPRLHAVSQPRHRGSVTAGRLKWHAERDGVAGRFERSAKVAQRQGWCASMTERAM